MDLVEVFSSDSDDNRHSYTSEGDKTITTEAHKTKPIKKYYEPISEGGKTYKFEDNPAQYKRMRKKIQNRQSATRVRGRKKNAFQSLQSQVQFLRKQNSQLQLSNAKLQTQNKYLKQQAQFLKTLIKPNSKHDLVQDYLSESALTHQPSPSQSTGSRSPAPMSDDYDSPAFEEFNWLRSDSSSSHNLGWIGLAIFAIVLALFVIPNDANVNSAIIASANGPVISIQTPIAFSFLQLAYRTIDFVKVGAKYLLIIAYVWLVYRKVYSYIHNSKTKKTNNQKSE